MITADIILPAAPETGAFAAMKKDDYVDLDNESPDEDYDPDEASNSRYGNPEECVCFFCVVCSMAGLLWRNWILSLGLEHHHQTHRHDPTAQLLVRLFLLVFLCHLFSCLDAHVNTCKFHLIVLLDLRDCADHDENQLSTKPIARCCCAQVTIESKASRTQGCSCLSFCGIGWVVGVS